MNEWKYLEIGSILNSIIRYGHTVTNLITCPYLRNDAVLHTIDLDWVEVFNNDSTDEIYTIREFEYIVQEDEVDEDEVDPYLIKYENILYVTSNLGEARAKYFDIIKKRNEGKDYYKCIYDTRT